MRDFTYKQIQEFGFGRCNKCNEWKPSTHFHTQKKTCKKCINESLKKYLSENSDRLIRYRKQKKPFELDRSRKYRETPIGKAKILTQAAIGRASRANLPCDLTWETIFVMLTMQHFCCAQTGIAFDFKTLGTSNKHRKLTAPSIDRIDPDKGYIVGNIQIVCWFYNAAKGTSGDVELWNLMQEAVNNKNAA